MFKAIKQFFANKRQKKAQQEQLKKLERYYLLLREGSMFLRFIEEDLKKTQQNTMNRHHRRRFQREIIQKGTFSKEFIEFYAQKIDVILNNIENQKQAIRNSSKSKVKKNERNK